MTDGSPAMLWVFVSFRHRSQVESLRRWRGGEFKRFVRTIPYETLRHRPGLPGGAYLFTNLEMLPQRMFERVARVAAAIREASPNAPIYNDPRFAKRRFELGRSLYREGINSFNMYRADEGLTPELWPVFVRGEKDHYGGDPALLAGPAELDAALDAARQRGRDLSRRLIVEFRETRGADGIYRKYGAFRVGSELVYRHVIFRDRWVVKLPSHDPTQQQFDEEMRFLDGKPHRDLLMRAFDIAGLEFGRIDFGIRDDGIEVWEINTNPTILSGRVPRGALRYDITQAVVGQVADALLALAQRGAGQPRIPSRALLPIRPRHWRRLLG